MHCRAESRPGPQHRGLSSAGAPPPTPTPHLQGKALLQGRPAASQGLPLGAAAVPWVFAANLLVHSREAGGADWRLRTGPGTTAWALWASMGGSLAV